MLLDCTCTCSCPSNGGTNGRPLAQVGAGPSKSAKKKAKKKAAAARKVDAVETNGTEGLEEAGTSNGSTESNGTQPAETNGIAGKKKKNKGMVYCCRMTVVTVLNDNAYWPCVQ